MHAKSQVGVKGILIAVLAAGGFAARAIAPSPALETPNIEALPLSFEANQGQADPAAQFLARGNGYTLALTPRDAVFARLGASQPVRIELVDASPLAALCGEQPLPGRVHYLRGNDPSRWQVDVPTYARVRYEQVYPGVDLVFYGNQRQIEYDFVLAPGVKPDAIELGIHGAEAVRVDEAGDLVIESAGRPMRFLAPTVYQEIEGVRLPVPGRFTVEGLEPAIAANPCDRTPGLCQPGVRVRFDVGPYDPDRPLVIDPVLAYSTYLGGSGDDTGDVAFDAAGNAYLSGTTTSPNFPLQNPYQNTPRAGMDTFVAKLNAAGNALVYSTYLGGDGDDDGDVLHIDSSGNVLVAGATDSTNFPVANAVQPQFGGVGQSPLFGPARDMFLTKLNASGNGLIFSTYLGGSGDEVGDFQVDPAGAIYADGVTSSTNFPTANAFQPAFGGGTWDRFYAKYGSNGSRLYASYLGGSGSEFGLMQLWIQSSDAVFLAGNTASPNFPTVNAYQSTYGGGSAQFMGGDLFVTRLNASSGGVVFSTYIGGKGDDLGTIHAVDASGNLYLAGTTTSTNFPTLNAAQNAYGGGEGDLFVTKLGAGGNALVFSTYLGGSGDESLSSILQLDASGQIYICGQTDSANYPTRNPIQTAYGGGAGDIVLTKLNSSGNSILYSTYLGGNGSDSGSIRYDPAGHLLLVGMTTSSNLSTRNAFQPAYGGAGGLPYSMIGDVFVAKLNAADFGLVYATYLGGSGPDQSYGYITDASGNLIIAGTTASPNFPVASPIQAAFGGGTSDLFLTKISSSGALVYSSYLGGSGDEMGFLERDPGGSLILSGATSSPNFPTKNPFQITYGGGDNDVFFVKITDNNGTPGQITLVPVNQSVPAAGGDYGFQVNASSGTAWTVANTNAWIQVLTGSSGSGSGPVTYRVSANTGPARTGTLKVGTATFTVNQGSGAACTFTLSKTSTNFPAAGGGGTVTVNTSAGCEWTASTAADWIFLTVSSGNQTGPIVFEVDPNPGTSSRSGTIVVEGQVFTINQAGATAGSVTINPSQVSIDSMGGSGTVNVTASSSTTWTATSNQPDWIFVITGQSGTGNGEVMYIVMPNYGAARTGTITIGNQTFTVQQSAGGGPLVVIDPDSANVPAAGDSGSFSVFTTDDGAWTAVSQNAWIHVTGGASGIGPGMVNYTVDPNAGGPRTGTIQVNGITFTVDQAGTGPSAANLNLFKAASAEEAEVDTDFDFYLDLFNAGPDPASQIVVTDTLPAGMTLVAMDVTEGTWSRSGSIVTWTVSALDSDASAYATITVRSAVTGLATNRAQVASISTDPDLSDNAAEAVVNVIAGEAPEILEIKVVSGNIQIRFTTLEARIYQVQRASMLDPADWAPVGSPILGTGSPAQYAEPAAGEPRIRYYRVELTE